ncbi:hypothetical protein PTNB73_01867 [Pyrenophora teres f. teres]|nr:hypothetical protein HRS9139_00453 [Pyrenophora teres f. teres]KAE8848024.1 hypothetical protein PTNB85_01867 [Pyrenophora teres f. teres]KAE8853814.1 hypothetical protein HRS9122_00806 [Pyrenophora teres f. teres]KAE8872716.1 hypothetical protein PTNB73_01867 [Pyrenophora teres f. teres]
MTSVLAQMCILERLAGFKQPVRPTFGQERGFQVLTACLNAFNASFLYLQGIMPPPIWGSITAVIIAVLSFYASHVLMDFPLSHSFYSVLCKTGIQNRTSERLGKPYHSSWNSWWHPQQSRTEIEQGAGTTTEDWNILYHLGGNGPWIEKVIDVVDGGIAPPDGCEVIQVHMMARHAERYPTRKAGKAQNAVFQRMKASNKTFTGNLSFFNNWTLYWTCDQTDLEQLTSTGPFAGTLSSFTTGVRLRTRYQHLLTHAKTSHPITPTTFWASNSSRVIQTAKHFASGFFGLDYTTTRTANLSVISEHSSLGGNTLTPGRTCLANKRDEHNGQRNGYRLAAQYRATYMPPIRERLLNQTDMYFSDQEIYAMQEMCGFETTVRGRSDWCNVFTKEEFLSFEYARDLLHYYRAGPGLRYGVSMGWLWVNATTNLLVEGPEKVGPLYFSFVHDGDIAPMLAALDIINDPHPLPLTHIPHDRKWRKSQVSPMGGRIIFELLSCSINTPTTSASTPKERFVRLNINDGITAIPDCNSGPGQSCSLAQFAERTKRKGEEQREDFRSLCGLDEGSAERITFLKQAWMGGDDGE